MKKEEVALWLLRVVFLLVLLLSVGDKVLPQQKRNEGKILKRVTSRFESFIVYLQSFPPTLEIRQL